MEFWLCSSNATDSSKLDLDLLKLLEEAKNKIKDPGTINIVDSICVNLKDHLCCLSKRLVPPTLFSARITARDKNEMAKVIPKYQNQARPDCQQMPETEDFGAKLLKHLVGPDSGICFELLHGKKPAFLTKRVQKWYTEEL